VLSPDSNKILEVEYGEVYRRAEANVRTVCLNSGDKGDNIAFKTPKD
jgi:hypothetical protein